MATPRKKTTVNAYGGKAPNTIQTGLSRKASSAAPTSAPKVTQPVAPTAPKLAAVPQIAAAPPPPSLQSTSDRNTANYDYGTSMGDVNSQLRSLAAQYGGAPQVTQYGYDANKGAGGDTQSTLDVAANQPGSTLEVLARNLGLTKGNINDTNEAQNTFFSSRRISDLGNADSQYTGDAAAAKRTYDDAVSALTTAILQGRGTRNTNLTNADIADAQAAAQTTPEAQSTTPAAPPGTIRTVNGVNITPQNWTSGSYTNNHGNEVRRFADGHQEVWDPKTKTWKYVK